jgi:competence protein ComEC
LKTVWQNIEQYFLISVCLSFLAGILLYHFFPLSLPIATYLSGLLFFPVLFTIKKSQSQTGIFFLLLLIISLGFFRLALHKGKFIQETTLYATIDKETDVVVSGTLHSMPLFDGEKSTILLNSHYLKKEGDPNFTQVTGLVQIKFRERLPEKYKPGNELLVRCKLSRPYRFGNPGGFDYPAFLAAKNISLIGRTGSAAQVHALEYDRSLFHQFRYFPEKIRCTIRDFLNNHLAPEPAAIYRALLIGDRTGIDKERFETFKASGVVHIFAISGIHLSLVASALFVVVYWLLRRSRYILLHFACKKIALLITIPFLTGYALLAGAQTPVLRSLIMVIVFILAFRVHRQRSPFTTLSFAALIILLSNPLSLFTVSFQLSFAAVASLILILPKLTILFQTSDEENTVSPIFYKKCVSWILAALLISIAATLGTAPLLLYYFNRISTVGPFANLLLEPLLCLWSLPIGLLAIPFIYVAPEFSEFLFATGNAGITSSLFLSDFFSGLSFSTVWFATPSAVVIFCYYIAVLYCFKHFNINRIFILLLTCSLFFFPPRSLLHFFSKNSELIFLDVGQGSATLVILPHGKTILVDGGGALSKKFNVGESVIAPYLWYRGFTSLDAILISHPDADHYSGIPFLLEHFKPKTLWINGDSGHDQRYLDLLTLANDLFIEVRQSGKEQIVGKSKEATLQAIYNPFQNDQAASSNDRSIVLRFTHGKFSSILSGDISKRVEEQLLLNRTTLQTNIFLSPHHGSKTSNSYPFLKEVKPQKIIVSAGRFHPENFPSGRLRIYCKQHAIPLLNTANLGAITAKFTNETITVTSFRK